MQILAAQESIDLFGPRQAARAPFRFFVDQQVPHAKPEGERFSPQS